MNKIKRSFALGVIFWGATNLSQISLAQYWVPIQPPVPRHDTMFPRRNRSINNSPSYRNTPSDSTPTSQLTPEQIREVAKGINGISQVPIPVKQSLREAICHGDTVPSVQGRRLSPGEMLLLKNELGC